MLKHLNRFLAIISFVVIAVAASASGIAKHVVIVSFDGGGSRYMRRAQMPTLFSMVKEGAHAWDARTVFPSITLVSHTSMLTGYGPAKHHILWNDWAPSKGLVKVPTSFQLAHKAGYSTAFFASKDKFKHLNLPGTIDEFKLPEGGAKGVAAAAAAYIVKAKPELCFVHFTDTDATGHAYGWGSDKQRQAFADEDAALKVVRDAVKKAGIESSTVFILTADHGGHAKTHGSLMACDMTIPWIAWGTCVKKGYTLTERVHQYDTAITALWLLGVDRPDDCDGVPVYEAFNVPYTTTGKAWTDKHMAIFR